MTTTHIRSPSPVLSRLAAGFVLVVALLAALGVTTPTGYADANDEAFLAALRSKGISYESPATAITAGHLVCESNDQNLWMSLGGAREKWAHLP
ncbi:DUF732 domain-containing protein, partial [Mycobacterium avium]|uniref:DUF732 domain-containing protein n=1 Tax=Mycobacterium avium TaxID=1764 RepID=UPI0011450253